MTYVTTFDEWFWATDIIVRVTVVLFITILADQILTRCRHQLSASAMWRVCLMALLAIPVASSIVMPAQMSIFSVNAMIPDGVFSQVKYESYANWLSGTVVDEDGRPIKDAEIVIMAPENIRSQSDAKKFTTNSTKDGKFNLGYDIPLSVSYPSVAVIKPGYAVHISRTPRASLWILDYKKPTYRLKRPEKITIDIKDENDKPLNVESCRFVFIYTSEDHFKMHEGMSLNLPVKIIDNTIELGSFSADMGFRLAVRAVDGREQILWMKSLKERKENSEQLENRNSWTAAFRPTGTVSGRVSKSDGAPLADAKVIVTTRSGYEKVDPGTLSVHSELATTTNENGDYQLEQLATGKISEFWYFDRETGWGGIRNSQHLEEGQVISQDVKLKPMDRVTGVVVDEDGNPVEGAELHNWSGGNPTWTNMNGEYEFLVRKEPTNWDEIYVANAPVGYTKPLKRIDLTNEKIRQTHILDNIVVEKAVPIHGKVVDPEGRPVAGAMVRAAWVIKDQTARSYDRDLALTNDEGAFVLRSVSGSATVSVIAQANGMCSQVCSVIEPNANRDSLEIVISKDTYFNISGRAINASGGPIENADIVVRVGLMLRGLRIPVEFAMARQTCQTDEEGNFVYPARIPRFASYLIKVEKKESPRFREVETDWLAPTYEDMSRRQVGTIDVHFTSARERILIMERWIGANPDENN